MQEQVRLGPLEPPERAQPAADAAPGGSFACTVTATGAAEDGNIYIGLRFTVEDPPPATSYERWYSAVASKRREMLATALTAITTQLPVLARLTTRDEYGTINRLYIFQP
jgi:hypothetical protein